MKTIRFVGKDKGQFTAAVRKNVDNYFKQNGISSKGNGHMLFKIITLMTMYTLPFVCMLVYGISGWPALLLWAIMGVGMSGIGMGVMHDSAHGSLSKKKWLNKLVSHSMYLIGGNTFNWKLQHNVLHHTYTNIDGHDEDIEPKGSMRFSKLSPLKKIHRFQFVYAFFLYSLMSFSRLFNEFKQLNNFNKMGLTKAQGSTPKKEMGILIVGKIMYLSVFVGLPILLCGGHVWNVILGFMIMHMIAGLFMSVVFQMAHVVEGVDQPVPNAESIVENEWMVHEMETTANFGRKSVLLGWIIGGLNYQVEHHLFPNICHVHYKAISPIVESTAKEFGVPYKEYRTFFGAVASHIRLLKALGKEEVVLEKQLEEQVSVLS
jgi:linoleoyl-CoA desaturase